MRGFDILLLLGYCFILFVIFGQQLVCLGQVMQNFNIKFGELIELVQVCGVDLWICDMNKESWL